MGPGNKTVTVYFTGFAGLLLTGLALFSPLPPWVWMVLAATAGTALFLFMRGGARSAEAGSVTEPAYAPPPPVEPLRQNIEVTLPSMEPDYEFLFSATVRWSPIGGTTNGSGANLGNLAISAVLKRATAVTESRPPGRASLIQHELNGVLGTMQPDTTERVRAMAESVTLALSDQDRRRLDRLAEIRKQRAVWEHERKHEQSKREYLRQDVLKDPGSTVVWWLAKHDDQVKKVVGDLGDLARLSSAANNREVPEYFRNLVSWPPPSLPADGGAPFASFRPEETSFRPEENSEPFTPGPECGFSPTERFAAFLDAMGCPEGDPKQSLFSWHMADVLAKTGHQDVADDLRLRFGTFRTSTTCDEAPSSAPSAPPGPSSPSDRPVEAPPADDLE